MSTAPGTQLAARLPGDIGAAIREAVPGQAASADVRLSTGPGGSGATQANGGGGGTGAPAPVDPVVESTPTVMVKAVRYGSVENGITGSLDGVNDEFTLAYTPTDGWVDVKRNGQSQVPAIGGDANQYSLAGAVITFTTPSGPDDPPLPASDEVIVVDYRREA